jgi:hypothetical protein
LILKNNRINSLYFNSFWIFILCSKSIYCVKESIFLIINMNIFMIFSYNFCNRKSIILFRDAKIEMKILNIDNIFFLNQLHMNHVTFSATRSFPKMCKKSIIWLKSPENLFGGVNKGNYLIFRICSKCSTSEVFHIWLLHSK